MAKFFEYGEVESVCSDHQTRQIALKVCAPWCVVQAAVPVLLGHGFIDLLRLSHPLAAWTPPLSQSRFTEAAVAEVPNIDEKVNAMIQNRVMEMLQLFSDAASVLKNSDDVIGLLPMSAFVTFQFRTTYEDLSEIARKLEPFGTPGLAEFRYALASVLAEALISAGSINSLNLDGQRVPPVLGAPMAADFSNVASSALSAHGQDPSSQDR